MSINTPSYCPVCGYTLCFTPYEESDGADICSSCGFQFGIDDGLESEDDLPLTVHHARWREKWIKNGMRWWGRSDEKPKNWDPMKQLENINV